MVDEIFNSLVDKDFMTSLANKSRERKPVRSQCCFLDSMNICHLSQLQVSNFEDSQKIDAVSFLVLICSIFRVSRHRLPIPEVQKLLFLENFLLSFLRRYAFFFSLLSPSF